MAFQNKEQEIEHYTKVFCDMLETMEYSLEKKENGKYCLVDKQSEYLGNKKNYEEIEKGSASAVVDRVSTYLNDYYFNVLQSAASGDFDIDFSQPDVPTTAEDWIKFMDANENFKKEYFHEYEVMKMLSSSEILNAIKLDDVCQHFISDATHEKGKELREMNENSKNWTNYGDVNFLDEGGVQIRATDREDIYDAIIVIPNPENENTVFAGHLTIDISDYRKNAHAEQIATESFGADYTDEQLAVVVAENEGLPELGATAFNDNSSLAAYAMSWEAFEIDKAELEPMLIELGIDIDVQYNSSEKEEITADSIIDIENDIQINDDYNKLDVYVVMDDQTLDRLMKRADMYEKSGYKDFDEIIGSSAIVNLYFVADEKGVDIVLTLDDGEKYHDVTFSEHPDENEFPLSHDESEMIREKLEHFLGKSAVEYLKAEKWKDMDTSDIKQLTAKDITPEDITAMQEAGYKFTDVYDYAKSRNLLLGELMGVKAIYDNRLITYHAEAKDDYGKMYDIDEDTIQELENNILMIDELVAAETESKYHLVVISRDPGEEVLVPVVIRTEDKTLLPFSQMLEEVKALIPEKLEGYATPISETEDLPVEVKTMDKLSMLYDLANDELDMLYALAERDKLYDLADAEFAGTIRRTNGMESDFLDIMRYMGVDLERINEAFHRAESIVTEGIGSEEDKRYQCEVLHGNVRDRFSETLQESVHSISKDSIADGLITQAFVDSYLNEAKTMAAEREPSKPKKEKPSIELN